MEQVQAVADVFDHEEGELLVQRESRARALSGLLGGGLIGFALILGAFVWFGLRRLEEERRKEKEAADRLAELVEEKESLLKQRELLLQEVNHRVKNSLSQIAGVLRLQMRGLDEGDARQTLGLALTRIMAIGRVHEQMYKTEQIGVVNAVRFLEPLCREIVETLLPPGSGRLELEIEPLSLPMVKAVPLSLLVNELLTNAAKYAVREDGACVIRLELKADGALAARLVVSDNGPGLPHGFDIEASRSLGMRLVSALAAQLDGTLTMASDGNGTRFELVVPLDGPAADQSPV